MVLPLSIFPDKVLRDPAQPVVDFNADLKNLAEDMKETMLQSDGVGLAAPQIGKGIRLVVIREGENSVTYHALVNPEITFMSDKTAAIEEGCLSLPGIFGYVERAAKIRYTYYDLEGKKHTAKASGNEAIVVQHEIDHINGILIVDRKIQITQGAEIIAQWQRAGLLKSVQSRKILA